jgi:hypothetical protein
MHVLQVTQTNLQDKPQEYKTTRLSEYSVDKGTRK